MKKILSVLFLVALVAAASAWELEALSPDSPVSAPVSAPTSEPTSAPETAPVHVPTSAPMQAPEAAPSGTPGTIPFYVYATADCSGNPIFSQNFVDDFSLCQVAAIKSLHIHCIGGQTIEGVAFDNTNCQGSPTPYPNATTGVCTQLPQGSQGSAIKGYCPGSTPNAPSAPSTPPTAPPSAASSLFVSYALVALALLGLAFF